MTEDQARLLFLDHCQPGSRGALERHGERPAVAAILTLAEALEGLEDVLTEAESRADKRWERESPDHNYRPGLLAEVNAVKQACATARNALKPTATKEGE